jgi:hypothetical protein
VLEALVLSEKHIHDGSLSNILPSKEEMALMNKTLDEISKHLSD